MKIRRRTASILTVCVLLAVFAAGCGSNNGSAGSATGTAPTTTSSAGTGDNATLRVAWWGNQVRNDVTVAALNVFTEQNPGIKFETEFSDWSVYWDKMATQAAAGSLPDIIQQDYKYYKQYQGKGQLADLTPFVESGVLNLEDVSEGIIDSGKIDGRLYALCLGINAPAMLYDKEIVEKAGVTIKNNMTLDEYLEAAKTITEKTGITFNTRYTDGMDLIEFMVRGQGKILFEDGRLGIEDAGPLVPFYKLFEDGIAEGYMSPAEALNASVGIGIEQSPLALGKEWMVLQFSNMLAAYNSAAGKELGIVTWPVGSDDTQKSMYLKPSLFFSVTSSSENQEICARVLDFFTNSVEGNKKLLAERGVPISSKVAEEIKPLMDESNQQIFDYISEIEPFTSTINPPPPDGIAEVIKLIDSLTEQVVYKQMTAEQAAEKLFTEANEILEKAAQ